jgi:putative methionine-R-sulfoxide reductase with GAF domain
VTEPAKRDAYRGVIAAIDRMVNRGDEADDVLRAVVHVLVGRLDHVLWAGISLVEGDDLVLGPAEGERAAGAQMTVPIEYERRRVGELTLESDASDAFDDEDRQALDRVATLISQHTLVAWDTAGGEWIP